jgi:hypothetical protein
MTTADCVCYVDTGEDPEFYKAEIRTARVAHTCSECKDVIHPGDKYKYEKVFGVWEGDVSTYKTCMPCKGVRDTYFACGWIHGHLDEDFQECMGFSYLEVPDDEDD